MYSTSNLTTNSAHYYFLWQASERLGSNVLSWRSVLLGLPAHDQGLPKMAYVDIFTAE